MSRPAWSAEVSSVIVSCGSTPVKERRRRPASRPLGPALLRQVVTAGLLALVLDHILAMPGGALPHMAAGDVGTLPCCAGGALLDV